MTNITNDVTNTETADIEKITAEVVKLFSLGNVVHSRTFNKLLGIALTCVSAFAGVFHGQTQLGTEIAGAVYAGFHA